MSVSAAAPLDVLLALPPVAALGAPWRQALAQAAGPDPLPDEVLAQLGDTLAALARLNADGDVVLATILHDLPAWRARIEPQLAKTCRAPPGGTPGAPPPGWGGCRRPPPAAPTPRACAGCCW